jgi:hypothetical protein
MSDRVCADLIELYMGQKLWTEVIQCTSRIRQVFVFFSFERIRPPG